MSDYIITTSGTVRQTTSQHTPFTHSSVIEFDNKAGRDVNVYVWNQMQELRYTFTVATNGGKWQPGRGWGWGRYRLTTINSPPRPDQVVDCDLYTVFVDSHGMAHPRWSDVVCPVEYRAGEQVWIKNFTGARRFVSVYKQDGAPYPQLFGWSTNGMLIGSGHLLEPKLAEGVPAGCYRLEFTATDGPATADDDGGTKTGDGELRVGSGPGTGSEP